MRRKGKGRRREVGLEEREVWKGEGLIKIKRKKSWVSKGKLYRTSERATDEYNNKGGEKKRRKQD